MRPHRLLLQIGLLLLGATTSTAVEIGMTHEELIAKQGQPDSKLETSHQAIYRWPTLTVRLRDNRVENIQWRDLDAERTEAERRADMIKKQRQQESAAARLRQVEAEKAAAEFERLRPERERAQLAARVDQLERDKQAADAQIARLNEQAVRERAARIAILQKEIYTTLSALHAAKETGNDKLVRHLRGAWYGKEQELKLLRTQN